MNLSNIKDWLSTICGLIIALCGPGTGILWLNWPTMPHWLTITLLVLAGVAVYVKALLVGKNPDGSTKTSDQINALNAGK